MDAKTLVELRKQAEKAVADMPDGELKLKAFEVMLNHLLQGPPTKLAERVLSSAADNKPGRKSRAARKPTEQDNARSLGGRVLVLRDEGFFKTLRSISEVREELQAHGWHYPLTTLSGAMISLVQQRNLRRQRLAHGKRKVWKYSEP